MTSVSPAGPARLALVGERSPHVRAHRRIPQLLTALHGREGLDLDAYWIPTTEVGAPGWVTGFDGVWLLPGSPYRSLPGALAAVRGAREGRIPFLGTCGGFQHALLEFGRNVCGSPGAAHAEYTPDADDLLIVPLTCQLAGHELAIRVEPGSLAQRALGTDRTLERYSCSYGPSRSHLELLTSHGLRFTGRDDAGEPRIAELPGHPFFLGTLFQPELADSEPRPHPILRAFARAVAAHAAGRLPGRDAGSTGERSGGGAAASVPASRPR